MVTNPRRLAFNAALGLAPLAALVIVSKVANGQFNPTKTQWWTEPNDAKIPSGLWVTMGAFAMGGALIHMFGKRR